MYENCSICGSPTLASISTITPYGLLPICSDTCLIECNNSDVMPSRIKVLIKAELKENKNAK